LILLKKILFPLFSVFLFYRTIDLMNSLLSSDPNDFGFSESLVVAFLLPLFITGVFAFPGFAYATSRLMGPKYFKLKYPEKLMRIYNIFGVKYFRVFLLIVFWGRGKNREKYFNGTRKGLQNFVYQSKQSEFGHLCAFVSILFVSIVLLIHGYFILIVMVTVINIFGNLYPIILQRFHRIRIDKIVLMME